MAKDALENDYAAMLADQIMIGHTIAFEALLNACANSWRYAIQLIDIKR